MYSILQSFGCEGQDISSVPERRLICTIQFLTPGMFNPKKTNREAIKKSPLREGFFISPRNLDKVFDSQGYYNSCLTGGFQVQYIGCL